MKSNYSFLARNQKTEEDKQRNNIDSMWSQLGSMGFVGKNSFFTGYGEDGELQPNRPTGILNTSKGPKTVHEGEPVDIMPDGSFSVTPASQVSMNNGQGTVNSYLPASQLGGQSNLEQIERNKNIQGYATGTPDNEYDTTDTINNIVSGSDMSASDMVNSGMISNIASGSDMSAPDTVNNSMINSSAPSNKSVSPELSTNSNTDIYQPYQTRGIQRLERYADSLSPLDQTVMNQERERFAGEAATSKGSYSQELSQAGITGREAATEQFMLGRQIGSQENEMMQDLRKNQLDRGFTAAQQLPNAVATAQAGERAKESLEFSKQQWSDTEGERMLSDALVMSEDTWLAKHPGTTANDYQTARDQATLSQKAQQLNEDRFAQEKVQYGDSENWKAYEAAVVSGDFGTAASLYKSITGNELDTTTMIEYQNYLMEKQTQELLSGDMTLDAQRLGLSTDKFTAFVNAVNSGADLTAANNASGLNLTPDQFNEIRRNYTAEGQEQQARLESLKNTVGQEKYNSIMDRIATGASLVMINNEFGTQLTADDYMNMKATTPYGQTQWERSMTAANMLMQTQTPENMQRAADMYENLFPGVGEFNVSQLIDDIGVERFSQGMTDIATIAATFDTWEEAKSTIDGMNLVSNMGLTEDRAHELFQALKINQIDEEWSAIEDSEYFKRLQMNDPGTAQLIQDTFAAGLSGELEFDIQPVYKITDENGALVKSFGNIEEANTYLSENPDKNYSVEEGKNYIYKNIMSGDTVVVNNGGEIVEGTDSVVSIGDAWNNFQDTQSELPEDQQITYADWKAAWEKADRPTSYTYDDYVKNRGDITKDFTTALVDTYKNGWPTVQVVSNVYQGGPYITTEAEKQEVINARTDFMGSPDKTININSSNAVTEFEKIYNDFNTLIQEGGMWKDFQTKKYFYVEGYDAPFMLKGPYALTMSTDNITKVPEVIDLISLKDGEVVTLNRNGEVSSSNRYPLTSKNNSISDEG